MGSSIYNNFNSSNMNNFSNFLNQFNEFRSAFSGNPRQQVQQLIQSGRMSQQQFDELANQATQLRQLLKQGCIVILSTVSYF